MIEQGDRIYKDEMLKEELCYMCLSNKPLRQVYHTSPNQKEIYVCHGCIKMNGHTVIDEN